MKNEKNVRLQAFTVILTAMACVVALTVGALSPRFFQNNASGASVTFCIVLSPYGGLFLLATFASIKKLKAAFLKCIRPVSVFGVGMFLLAFSIALFDHKHDGIAVVMLGTVSCQWLGIIWLLATQPPRRKNADDSCP